MQRNVRTFTAAVAVLVLMLSIATLAVAGPPGLTRNIGPPEHAQAQWENGLPPGLQDKGIPPGLQDKGGLPPGMHGREVLPPGIQMRFVNTLQGQWEGKEAGFYILGSEYIDISGGESLTEIYQAVLVDDDGNGRMVTAEAEWTLDLPEEDGNDNGQDLETQAEEGDNGLEGISITEYGVLKIAADVEPTTIIINASYTATADEGEEPETLYADLQVELYEPKIAAVQIIGAEYIELAVDGELITEEYTANILDQYEQIMIEGAAVHWWIGDQEGVEMQEPEGVWLNGDEETSNATTLNVSANTEIETLWLWADYAENEDSEGTEIKGSLVITLSEMESSEDE